MAIAKSTLDFIIKEEGSRNKAYKDSKGLLTIVWPFNQGGRASPKRRHAH